jgi:multicomponent Na+:H+ antiporter subunit G
MMDIVVSVLLLIGAVVMVLAAIGVLRMPDLFTRMQATTKAATLGVACFMLAVAIAFGEVGIIARALVVLVFTFLTAPISAHVMARAAFHRGEPLWKGTVRNESADPSKSQGARPE